MYSLAGVVAVVVVVHFNNIIIIIHSKCYTNIKIFASDDELKIWSS